MSKLETTNPVVEIRMASIEDAYSVASVLLESFIEYRPSYTPDGFAATTPSAEQIIARMNEGPLWIALLDGVAVGTVSAVVQAESVYIRGMAVLPAARGHRIGELLMNDIQSLAYASGCKRLFLSTTPFLHRAIALYERLGFHRTGAGPHDLHGTPLLTMEKILDPLLQTD